MSRRQNSSYTQEEWASRERQNRKRMPPPDFIPLKRRKRKMEDSFSSFLQEIADIKLSPTAIFLSDLETIETIIEDNPPKPDEILHALGFCSFHDEDVKALLDRAPPWVSAAALKVRREDWRAGALRSEYVVKCLLNL
eukprot:GEMP01050466.1.p1 GENE.GEMP01050466.1~~GEMP01050466.1.p1  ORF type:complete len:138 (+),score=30.73 GEMP01050466.1:162-575(+)